MILADLSTPAPATLVPSLGLLARPKVCIVRILRLTCDQEQLRHA